MSHVGKKPVVLPAGVKVSLQGDKLLVEGPKGKLVEKIPEVIRAEIKDNQIFLVVGSKEKYAKALHGLVRSNIANKVLGASQGFTKILLIEGTGYRASIENRKLNLQLGFSHPIALDAPQGIDVEIEKQTKITIKGADKQLVGGWAATIRALKPPEPYKGKGIRYSDEVIRKKAGKAAVKQTT